MEIVVVKATQVGDTPVQMFPMENGRFVACNCPFVLTRLLLAREEAVGFGCCEDECPNNPGFFNMWRVTASRPPYASSTFHPDAEFSTGCVGCDRDMVVHSRNDSVCLEHDKSEPPDEDEEHSDSGNDIEKDKKRGKWIDMDSKLKPHTMEGRRGGDGGASGSAAAPSSTASS